MSPQFRIGKKSVLCPTIARTGRAAGDAVFVARVEKITGRDLSKGKPGRPRKRPS
ncbi:MAG: hypothetical protein V1792_03160 [Pseudomonadota bacterium]